MISGPFGICIADPAWSYTQQGTNGASGEHYKSSISTKDLNSLGPMVSDVMSDDAILLVWCTWPFLKEGIGFIESCGFEYKTCGGIWCKTNKKSPGWFFGLGFYVRGNTEPVLLGVRGKPKVVSRSVRQIMTDPIMKHSQKPAVLHRRAEQLLGDVPRLELFARRETDGWHCLGNELAPFQDLKDSLPALSKSIRK